MIPKLISNRHGRAQPMTREQRIIFDDDFVDFPEDGEAANSMHEDDEIESGLRSDEDTKDIPF